ncbi:MAG: LamG domain-containing protein [Armatimonadota bacterium]
MSAMNRQSFQDPETALSVWLTTGASRAARRFAIAAAVTAGTAGMIAATPVASHAQTIGYYRFEEGTVGSAVPVTPDAGAPAQSPVLDSSGNGNNFKTFATFTAPVYGSSVPAATVPRTGAANLRSLGFTPNQDIYSLNAVGGGPNGGTLNDHNFSAFTIEASVRFNDLGGFQTFVGRDRPGQTLGGFYLRKWGGNDANLNTLNVTVVADNNTTFDLFSTGTGAGDTFSTVSANVWYNVVAQSTGTQLSLFVQNNGTGVYELQGSLAINTALSNTGATNFTLGRGWFNNPADFLNGSLDEVRISDRALAPSEFLFARQAVSAAPEPGSLTLLLPVLGVVGIILRRRKK